MPKSTPNWHVFTGAPSSGKTTTLLELEKLGYKFIPEMARVYIEQQMAQGKNLASLKTDTKEFEELVLDLKIDTEKKLDRSQVTFLDRGMHDTLAYYELYNWPKDTKLLEACSEATYKKVFLFEMLDYVDDGMRVEDEATCLKLQELFLKVYSDAGYKVVIIKKDSIENRVKEVLKHVEK